MLSFQFIRHIELEKVAGMKNLAGLQHGEDGSQQHHAGSGDDGAFLTTALHNAFVLDSEVGAFLGSLGGSVGSLDQSRLEVDACTRYPDRLIVAGSQTCPTTQTLGRAEYGHIRTDLRDDCDGETAVNARDGTVLCSVSLSITVYTKTRNPAALVFIPICAGRRAGMRIFMNKKGGFVNAGVGWSFFAIIGYRFK